MKRILSILVVILIMYQVSAQTITDTAALRTAINTDIVPNAAGGITATKLNRILSGILNTYPGITGRFQTVSEFAAYNKSSTIVEVADTLRGGKFNLYTGSDTADNGMIFADALGRKWLREVKDNKINVLWYGAKGDWVTTDNIVPFEAAREYIRSHKQYKTLKIPFYNNPSMYNRYGFSRTFVINLPMMIEGDGVGPWEASRLYFPANTTGLLFQPYNYDFNCGLININIENAFTTRASCDSNKALIVVHSSINMENVKVLYATGNGLEVSSDSGGDSTTNPNFGNAGFSTFKNVRVYEAINGFYIVGSESNSMEFRNIVAQANVRWGVLDDGLLGNTYYTANFQGNSNNALSGAATTVTYGGEYYAALPAHDDGSGIGKRPDQHEWTYWLKTGPRAAAAWDTTKHYWSGGSYYVKGANATTKFYQPYVEGDNGPYYLNARSESDGGIDGVGYGIGFRQVTGVSGHAITGTVTIINNPNPNARNGFGVGSIPDNITMTHFKNKSGVNTISTFEGYNSFALNRYENTTGSYEFGYSGAQFRAYTNTGSTKYFFADNTHAGFDTGPSWNYGSGSPESVVTAPVGSFYSRTDGGAGTALYFKESGAGNTGWVAAAIGSTPNLWAVISAGATTAGHTDIEADGYDFRINNAAELGLSGDSITFSANSGSNHVHIKGDSTMFDKKISYSSNIGSTFNQFSLVDKNYVDSSIAAGAGGGTPAGSDTQVQFNDGGAFGGDAGITYDKTTDALSVSGSVKSSLLIGGDGTTSDLILKVTTGVGTTGSLFGVDVGNNGAITALRINHVGGMGILNPTTIDANHGLTIKSPTNTAAHGLKVLSLNETVNAQYGSFGLETSSAYTITAAGGRIALNTTSGVFVGGSGTPVASAILESTSTTKGWLPPRMTATQGSAISSPAEGLLIYVTDTNGTFTSKGWWGYSGAAWEKLNN